MKKQTIQISVISDVVCPWCYIGKRRLEKAMAKLSDQIHFEVEYFPFELNPNIPSSGVDQKTYLVNKFGGEERYQQITQHVTSIAALEGLPFNFSIQKISPNTRESHRLIQIAKDEHKQLEMVEALFKAYFTEGIDLSKKENLASIAAKVGLSQERIESFLNTDLGLDQLEVAEQTFKQSGISGVPFYIINNKYGVSGAQPSDTFIKAFQQIALEGLTVIASDEGACDIDKKNC